MSEGSLDKGENVMIDESGMTAARKLTWSSWWRTIRNGKER